MADNVSPEMRKRLAANRQGRLSTDQWKQMVAEPIVPLLLLLGPLIIIFGARFALIGPSLCFVAVIVALVLLVPLTFRARRYARTQIHFARCQVSEESASSWRIWKLPTIQSETGEVVKFTKSLAPRTILRQDHRYLAYYMKDGDATVLLSIASADHPNAADWQPNQNAPVRLGDS